MIIYIISFMDRTNFGYALAGLGTDLGLDKTTQGFITGIFFVGYVFLQIPGGILATRWSAKRFIGIMILVWGVFAILEGLVQNVTQLIVVRFLLGVAEGGVWPAMLVLLSQWFPVSERARAYGFWMVNLAISSIITQPLSGAIVQAQGWRGLFVIEGPAAVRDRRAAVVAVRRRPAGRGEVDRPGRARLHRAQHRRRTSCGEPARDVAPRSR